MVVHGSGFELPLGQVEAAAWSSLLHAGTFGVVDSEHDPYRAPIDLEMLGHILNSALTATGPRLRGFWSQVNAWSSIGAQVSRTGLI
jgi:hypothetical protein